MRPRPGPRPLRRAVRAARFIAALLAGIAATWPACAQLGPLPLGAAPKAPAEKPGEGLAAAKETKSKKEGWPGKSKDAGKKGFAEKAGKEKAGKEKSGKEKAGREKAKQAQKAKSAQAVKPAKSPDKGDDERAKKSRCPPGQIYDKRSKGCL